MKFRFLFLSALLVFSSEASAWGKHGRKLVVEIARGLLDKHVIDVVDHYLGTGNWAEAVDWIETTATPRNAEIRKQWQQVLVPRDKTYVPSKAPNLINQIEYQLMVLEKRSIFPAKDVAESIKILFALVADAHQPLRCGYTEDRGGANVTVMHTGRISNLFKLWDDELLEIRKTDMWTLSKILLSLSQQERIQIQMAGHMTWITESRGLLKDVYTLQSGAADDAYLNRAKTIAEMQLVKAGLRLAALLKRNFKD